MADNNIDMNEINAAVTSTQVSMQTMSRSLDSMASQFKTITDLMGKQRDYTQAELGNFEKYKQSIADIAATYRSANKDQVKGMNDYSIALKAIEDKTKDLIDKSDKLKTSISNINKERQSSTRVIDEFEAKEREIGELSEKNAKLKELRARKGSQDKKKEIQELYRTEETHGAKLNSFITKDINANEKLLKLRRSELPLAKQAYEIAKKQRDEQDKDLVNKQKAFRETQKQIEQTKEIEKTYKQIGSSVRERAEVETRHRGGGLSRGANLGLQVASDLRIPGVSQAATVGRYAGALMPAGGMEEVGLAGMAARALGGLGLGAGVVAGGMVAKHGYDVYNYGGQLAEQRQAAEGLLGTRGLGRMTGLATNEQLARQGYGAGENYQFMRQFARQIGGEGALGQLVGVSKLARGYGLERSELGGQAEALRMGGGAEAGREVSGLQKIMSEGIKSGMDRARITTFTQQALGIQKEIYQATGENNAEEIAKALGRIVSAGGGERALTGAGMAGIRTLDQSMKAIAGGEGGPAAGTVLRAFGFAPGGQAPIKAGFEEMSPSKKYYEAMKFMEGGLFGAGEKGGPDAVERARRITGQYLQESGGDKATAAVRMKKELGIGLNQFDKMLEILDQVKEGTKSSDDTQKEIAQLMEGSKDPLVQIREQLAKQENILHKDAVDNADILKGISKLMTEMKSLQSEGVKALASTVKGLAADTKAGEAKGMVTKAIESGKSMYEGAKATGTSVIEGAKGLFKSGAEHFKEFFTPKNSETKPADKPAGKTSAEVVNINEKQVAALLEVLRQNRDGVLDLYDHVKSPTVYGNAGGNLVGNQSMVG